MPATHALKLYVKVWCPWCIKAARLLDEQGYQYEQIDVEASRNDYAEMIRLSGQHLTPTLVAGEKVLPDFGPDDLLAFLKLHGIQP